MHLIVYVVRVSIACDTRCLPVYDLFVCQTEASRSDFMRRCAPDLAGQSAQGTKYCVYVMSEDNAYYAVIHQC